MTELCKADEYMQHNDKTVLNPKPCIPNPKHGCRVTKVREFQRVAKLCEADGHMQQKLKQLLKLSKEKWDAACEHAKTAVQVFICFTLCLLFKELPFRVAV